MIYRGKFRDYSNKLYTLDITTSDEETAEDVTDITLGGTPFVVQLEGDSDDLFKPMRTSTATASIVSDQYLFDLYSVKNDIDIVLYDDDTIEWMGIVKPLIFNMGYNNEVEEIGIDCVDYISILEDIYLKDTTIITNKPIMTFGALFAKILSENTKYKYLYYPEFTDFNMLESYSVSTANFIDEKCKISDGVVLFPEKNWSLYKILEEMCRYMGVTLTIDGENVVLVPYMQLQFGVTYTKYTIGSTLSGKTTNVSCSSNKSISKIYQDSDLELSPVMNKFTVKTKTNKIENILTDLFDDDNLENITYTENGVTDMNTCQNIGYFTVTNNKEQTTYEGFMKFFKCKSPRVHNYYYTSKTDFTTDYPNKWSMMYDDRTSAIVDFKKKEDKEKTGSWAGGVPSDRTSDFKSSDSENFERYLVLCDSNSSYTSQGMQNPLFKIESDSVQLSNKMALRLNCNLLNTPYSLKAGLTNVHCQAPIECDEAQYEISGYPSTSPTLAHYNTEQFCNFNMIIKVGSYYFHNVGTLYDKNAVYDTKHFFRTGWWDNTPTTGVSGVQGMRVQFDNEENTWAFGKNMSITDNSADTDINQDDGGYWIMFNANESQGDGNPSNNNHVTLPESFTGKIEVWFYPNENESTSKKDGFKFGDYMQYLSNFSLDLVIPRDKTMTEEEWNSDTEISAVVDYESLYSPKDITCEIHTDFNKCPAYSIVIGSKNYSMNNIDDESDHCAEEWIVYNYTTQYAGIRKVLNTKVKEDIKPYSYVTMVNREHFEKMVVDSFKKDYRTGFTEVKLVEIADLT